MIALGAQWLKTLHQDHAYTHDARKLPNHSEEGYRAILEKGRENGIKCALHEPLVSGFKKGVDLGFDTLEPYLDAYTQPGDLVIDLDRRRVQRGEKRSRFILAARSSSSLSSARDHSCDTMKSLPYKSMFSLRYRMVRAMTAFCTCRRFSASSSATQ